MFYLRYLILPMVLSKKKTQKGVGKTVHRLNLVEMFSKPQRNAQSTSSHLVNGRSQSNEQVFIYLVRKMKKIHYFPCYRFRLDIEITEHIMASRK